MRGLCNSLSFIWVFHLALSHVTTWVLLWFESQKGSIFQVGSTECREKSTVIGQETNERKLLKVNIYISLPSVFSISNSSLYFMGPVQCTAHSRCSVLLADIVLKMHFWVIPSLDFYLYVLCLTLFLDETDLGAASTGESTRNKSRWGVPAVSSCVSRAALESLPGPQTSCPWAPHGFHHRVPHGLFLNTSEVDASVSESADLTRMMSLEQPGGWVTTLPCVSCRVTARWAERLC